MTFLTSEPRHWHETPADHTTPIAVTFNHARRRTAADAMIWRRSDRPEQMWLEWATTASFSNLTRVCGRYYEQIRKLGPDFFLHSGDTIYADDPLQAQGNLADGTRWNNVVTEEWSDNWSDIQRRQR